MSINNPSKNLPNYEVCDVCRKHVPFTVCEHGYHQSHLYTVELPMRYEQELDDYGGVMLQVCEDCAKAVYAALDARGEVMK